MNYAKTHLNWPAEKWRNVLCSDKSKVILFDGKGTRSYVRRPPNAEFNPKYTTKTIKHGGSSLMVWRLLFLLWYRTHALDQNDHG